MGSLTALAILLRFVSIASPKLSDVRFLKNASFFNSGDSIKNRVDVKIIKKALEYALGGTVER